MNSIIKKTKECYVCGNTNVHDHHIFFGNKHRNKSERLGLKVWLCYEHHEGTQGVHGKYGHELDLELKRIAQKKYEENNEDFVDIFGRNYL